MKKCPIKLFFGIKIVLVTFIYFPLSFILREWFSFPTNVSKIFLLFLYFIYIFINVPAFLLNGKRISILMINIFDCIIILFAFILGVNCITLLFTNPEGYYVLYFLPSVIAIFYYGIIGIFMNNIDRVGQF
jgi:hypothetical protein